MKPQRPGQSRERERARLSRGSAAARLSGDALLNIVDGTFYIAEEVGGDAVELLVVIPARDGEADRPQKTSSAAITASACVSPASPRAPK